MVVALQVGAEMSMYSTFRPRISRGYAFVEAAWARYAEAGRSAPETRPAPAPVPGHRIRSSPPVSRDVFVRGLAMHRLKTWVLQSTRFASM